MTLNDPPPPFSPGAWKELVLKHDYNASKPQRELNVDTELGESSWGRDLEKSLIRV
jgi:hypothetical protein